MLDVQGWPCNSGAVDAQGVCCQVRSVPYYEVYSSALWLPATLPCLDVMRNTARVGKHHRSIA